MAELYLPITHLKAQSQEPHVNFGASFYVDKDPPTIGVVHKNGKKTPQKGDFSIFLDTLVEAGPNTGYLTSITRVVDNNRSMPGIFLVVANYVFVLGQRK